MKDDEKNANESRATPAADDVQDQGARQTPSDLKWRIVVAVLVLAALAALVYKQSF